MKNIINSLTILSNRIMLNKKLYFKFDFLVNVCYINIMDRRYYETN